MSVEIFGEEFPGLNFEDIGLNFTSKYVEEHFPAIWKRAYTKHYDAPGSHAGFKAPATLMSMCAISVEQHMKKGDSVPTTSLAAAGELEKYDYPTYYVGRELFHAMQHTHPPKGMLWSEVFFPYPGMIFMLPNGALHNEDGSPITFLCIAKLLYGKIMRAGLIDVRLPWGKAIDHETQELDRIVIFWPGHKSHLVSSDFAFHVGNALEPDIGFIERCTRDVRQRFAATPDVVGTHTPQFSQHIAAIAANLLLLRAARPELVEDGGRTRKVLPKSGTPIHSPSWLGRRYAVVRKSSRDAASTGAHFTELRWRSGYYARRHVGPMRADERIVLVDPYLAFSAGLVRGA